MKHIEYLIDETTRILEKHLNNECYYKIDHGLSNYYDWSLPPEYKRSLFANTKPEWNKRSDMYYLMIKLYEHVTGYKPEVNFQLNDRAVDKLMSCLDIDDKGKRAFAYLFVRCTCIPESKRIKDASEFINTEAFKYIIGNTS